MNDINTHLAKLEELADALANPDGTEIPLARSMSLPPALAVHTLKMMRTTFLLGALAATGLLWPDDADVPEEWLARNEIPKVP